MKTFLKIIAIAVVLAFVGAQFYRIDKTNPPVVSGETIEAAIEMPADVSQILSRSCNDCHSNKTAYPWYSNVMPFSLFLEDHILEGRNELNFSKFATYTASRQSKKLEEICEQVRGGHMPLPSYLWIHRDAVLSESEISVLCDWSTIARAAIDGRQ